MIPLRTCVSEKGEFIFGVHRPHFKVKNLRENDYISSLGIMSDGEYIKNNINFPSEDINVPKADIIYEIPNPFPFRGTTYINSAWADKNANNPENIALPRKPEVKFSFNLRKWLREKGIEERYAQDFLKIMPQPLLIALADTSTDPDELTMLAEMSCEFIFKKNKKTPWGLVFKKDKNGYPRPIIKNHELFEVVVNNECLPEIYKRIMVLKPGVQGTSEITGEWIKKSKGCNCTDGINVPDNYGNDKQNNENVQHHCKNTTNKIDNIKVKNTSHIFEYLRKNSYIPWGHFAANTADDTVRYRIKALSFYDMRGMRHLYYQRTFTRLAEQLDIPIPCSKQTFTEDQLENLRISIVEHISDGKGEQLFFNGSLWGWNFGFGYAQSGYRLHASHQQIHQQYAMIPRNLPAGLSTGSTILPSYSCGDLVAEFIENYRIITGKNFFENYIKAIRSNIRTDLSPNGYSSLIIAEDENILLFVPKAQTSQWEIQLMAARECGNILEADSTMRQSLDKGIFAALGLLESMGARMVTCMEFSKRFDAQNKDQRVLYSFMPKIPQSPGAFSEAQLRWINGHYPEDFAAACRKHFVKFSKEKLL